jgi:hypothetical protein
MSLRRDNGSEFIFAGLRHNVSQIRSLEGIDIVWVEPGTLVKARAGSSNTQHVGIVTTASTTFTEFYRLYVKSWRLADIRCDVRNLRRG